MAHITYKEIHKDKWLGFVSAFYSDEVKQARALGFEDVYYVYERVSPLALLLAIDSVIINRFWRKECVWINWWPLEGMMSYPFALHREGYAYVTAIRSGMKYTTLFEDGTALQTISYHTTVESSPEHRYTRQRCKTGPSDTWTMHKASVQKLASENRVIVPVVSLQDALRIETHIDEITTLLGRPSAWKTPEYAKDKK